MIFLAEQRKLLFDNKDLVRFLQVKRGDELNFSIDISLEEENLSYQFTAKGMGQYSENPILLFSGVAVGKKAEFTLEANTVQLDNLFANDEKQIELMCEFAVWRDEDILKSLNEITLTVFNKITGPGEVDENGGEYPPASELVTFSEMTEEVSRQIEELGAHTSIENIAGALKLSSELKIEPETKTISFAESIESKSSWDFSGEIKRTTKEEPENGDLMNLEMTKKALEEAGSHTSIGGVSGDINLSDGLEIDSDTKTMGIGNAAVQSLAIADGGITQNIDKARGGKPFIIGETVKDTADPAYNFQMWFGGDAGNIECCRTLTNGEKIHALLLFSSPLDLRGSLVARNTFTATSLATFHGVSTFNDLATFNGGILNSNGIFRTPDGVTAKLGDYVESPTVADANKVWCELGKYSTNNAELTAYTVNESGLRTPAVLRIGSTAAFIGGIVGYGVAQFAGDLRTNQNFEVKGVSTFNGAVIANAGITNTIGNFYTPPRTTIAMGDVVANPTPADDGRSWFEISPYGATSRQINVRSVNPSGDIVYQPLLTKVFNTTEQLIAGKSFLISGKFESTSTALTNINLKDSNGRQILFLDATAATPMLCVGSNTNAASATANAYEVALYGRSAGIYTNGTTIYVDGGELRKRGHGVYTCASLGNSITGSWTFNAPQTFNAGITNTTGNLLSPSKIQRFGDYVENPSTADAGKNWLEIENTSTLGEDVTLAGKCISAEGVSKTARIRVNTPLIVNAAIISTSENDFRGDVKIGGKLTVSNGNIKTPMAATPTRIGEYVENPTIADVGKIWIEIQKKDGYIKILGKEVVNNVGEIEVQNYPVQI